MHGSDEKKNKIRATILNEFNIKPANYCMPGLLSKCGAGKTWAEQRRCRFAVKSDYANKCLYYNRAMDGHCDCIDAQKDAVNIFEDWYV